MPSRKTQTIRDSTELPFFDRAALGLLFLLLLSEILSGPIRYYAVQVHLVWLPYVPRFVLILALGPMFLARVLNEGITSTYLAVLVLFSVGVTYGVFNLGNASQVEFGVWTLTTFLYGVVVCRSLVMGWKKVAPYVIFMWVVAVSGVLINYFYRWPWAGLEYQVGAAKVTASHWWVISGVLLPRLTGFARSWFEAAIQILLLALFLKDVLARRWWLAVWVLSGIAITMTTTKTTILIFVIFSVLWVLRRGSFSRFWRALPVLLVGVDIMLPLTMFFMNQYWTGNDESSASHLLIATLIARIQREWPDAIRMIVTRGSPIFGRGVGGIGSSQMFFEPALWNSAENIAVFLYGFFGVLGLILLLVYAGKARRVATDSPVGRYMLYCACVVLLEGATMSVLEASVFLPLAFGTSLWYVQAVAAGRRYHVVAPVKPAPGPLLPSASQSGST